MAQRQRRRRNMAASSWRRNSGKISRIAAWHIGMAARQQTRMPISSAHGENGIKSWQKQKKKKHQRKSGMAKSEWHQQ